MLDVLKRIQQFVLMVFLLMFVAGCLSPVKTLDRSLKSYTRDPMQIARINSFLALETAGAIPMRMEVARIELLAGDTWLPLLSETRVFDSAEIGSGQIFVGAQNVPPGDYRRLRLDVTSAEALDSNGNYVQVLSEPRRFESNFISRQTLTIDDSKTLILSWDVNASLDAENRFAPALTVRSANQQIWSDLVFVSCPEIDTVFIIRSDTNRVVSSFGLKGGPTYMALDPESANRRLYVLCSRDRMIRVVELETYKVVEFFAVPLTDDPSQMKISPDGRSLYLLDQQGGYLTRMATDTGQILSRVYLDFRPSYLLYLEAQNLLAVSQALSQKVLLLDPFDLSIAGEFSTGNSPAGLLELEDQLYVAERGDNMVRVFDLPSRREQNRLTAGLGPRRLISSGRQIYISNVLDRSLSVLDVGGFGVVQRLSVDGLPGEMALNSFYRRLYIADEEGRALPVVDVNSNRLVGRIELGALPFGLVVIQ